jgi:hypothetical protein
MYGRLTIKRRLDASTGRGRFGPDGGFFVTGLAVGS